MRGQRISERLDDEVFVPFSRFLQTHEPDFAALHRAITTGCVPYGRTLSGPDQYFGLLLELYIKQLIGVFVAEKCLPLNPVTSKEGTFQTRYSYSADGNGNVVFFYRGASIAEIDGLYEYDNRDIVPVVLEVSAAPHTINARKKRHPVDLMYGTRSQLCFCRMDRSSDGGAFYRNGDPYYRQLTFPARHEFDVLASEAYSEARKKKKSMRGSL